MIEPERTVWRLRGINGRRWPELELRLVVDTRDPAVIEEIHRAARWAGIEPELEQLEPEPEP